MRGMKDQFASRRVSRRRALGVASAGVLGTAGLAMVGCGDDDSEGTSTNTPAPGETPTPGNGVRTPQGTLTVAVANLGAESANPFFQQTGADTATVTAAFESFFRIGDDGDAEPALATSMEMPDRTTIVYQMRDGVQFWDGTPLTVDDIVWSYDAFGSNDPQSNRANNMQSWVESVTASDERTIVVTLSRPSALLARDVFDWGLFDIGGWPIASQAYYDSVGPDEFARQPMCTGPFRLEELRPGESIEYSANEQYWDESRMPRVAELFFRFSPEQSTRIAQLQTGEADIIEGIAGAAGEQLRTESNVSVMANPQTACLRFNMFDLVQEPWNDQRLREAMQLAINQEDLAEGLLRMGGAAPNTLLFPSTPGFDMRGWTTRPHDPDRARALIEEAGLEGFSFTFHTYESGAYPSIPDVCQAIAAWWSDIGLNPEIRRQDAGAYLSALVGRELNDIGPQPWITPVAKYPPAMLSHLETGSGVPAVDDWSELHDDILEVYAQEDPDQQMEMALDVHKRVDDEALILFGPYADTLWGVSDRVQGWRRPAGMTYTTGLETVELSE